jgi:short subunit dehydrogenase-like uncharacterized protein
MKRTGPYRPAVTVFGASGHTGRFVVAELARRGHAPILSGRDAARLAAASPGAEVRAAALDDPASLDRALDGAGAVINCAGPFAATAAPVIEAALRAGVPYLDVAAEIEANADTFARYSAAARQAGVPVLPAMAFFGGLGDLLATAAMDGWDTADELTIAYGLSSWRPTPGTRAAGRVSSQRRDGRRVVYSGGRLELRDASTPHPRRDWTFPAPLGTQPVLGELTMADTLTLSRHFAPPVIHSYMTAAAVADLVDPATPPPTAADDSGRSAQTFVVELVARRGDVERRAVARGRDIYAVSAALVVEAAARVLDGRVRETGALTAGQAFDARELLAALAPEPLAVELPR